MPYVVTAGMKVNFKGSQSGICKSITLKQFFCFEKQTKYSKVEVYMLSNKLGQDVEILGSNCI